jgi:lysophospholipase L1-like esterase
LARWSACVLLLVFTAALGIAPATRPAVSEPAPLDYVALGDSITAGHDLLGGSREGFVPRYEAFIEADTGVPVDLVNLGVDGQSSSGLLRTLREGARVRHHVRGAEALTLDIGTNDLLLAHSMYVRGEPRPCGGSDGQRCLRTATARFKANYDAILQEIKALRGGRPTVLRAATLYDPFVSGDKKRDSHGGDGAKNDFEVFDAYYSAFNDHIATTATLNNVPYADVHRAFNGPTGGQDPRETGHVLPLPEDGIHPSNPGHAAIADLMRNLGYAPLYTPPAP